MAYSLSGERPAAVAFSFNPVSGLLRFLVKMRADRNRKAALHELLELDEFRLYDLGIDRQDLVCALRHDLSVGEALSASRAVAARQGKARATNFG